MGLRFSRRITLLPGVRINLGGRGASITLGPRGASVNLGPRGTFVNLGLPGSGLSYRARPGDSGSRSSYRARLRGQLPGRRAENDPGYVLDTQSIAGASSSSECSQDREYVARLLRILIDRQRDSIDWAIRAKTLDQEPPDSTDADLFDEFARAYGRARFAKRIVEGDRSAWCEVLYDEISNEKLPFEFSFDFSVDEATSGIELTIELPDVDVVPTRASRALKNGGISYRKLPPRMIRDLYQDVCCALVLRIVHEIYRVLPEADTLHVKGLRLEPDPRTGRIRRAVYVQFRTQRERFCDLDLDHVDPSEAFSYLGGASSKKRGMMEPLEFEDQSQ